VVVGWAGAGGGGGGGGGGGVGLGSGGGLTWGSVVLVLVGRQSELPAGIGSQEFLELPSR
jgi:hypothetical protein